MKLYMGIGLVIGVWMSLIGIGNQLKEYQGKYDDGAIILAMLSLTTFNIILWPLTIMYTLSELTKRK